MTSPETNPPSPVPEPPRPRRWLTVLLGLSLAANLLVVGVILGSLGWRGGGGPVVRSGQVELSVFPYTTALSRDDRSRMMQDWQRRGPPLRDLAAQHRADAAALATALRAEPFEPDAVAALLETRRQRLIERQDLAMDLLRDRLLAMDAEQRQAYADRLEAAAERGPRPRRAPQRVSGAGD